MGSSAREGLEQETSLLRVGPTACCSRLHPPPRGPHSEPGHLPPTRSTASRRVPLAHDGVLFSLPVLLPLLLVPSLDRVSYKSPNSPVRWRVPSLSSQWLLDVVRIPIQPSCVSGTWRAHGWLSDRTPHSRKSCPGPEGSQMLPTKATGPTTVTPFPLHGACVSWLPLSMS